MMVDIIFREYINGSDSKKIIMIMTIKTTMIKQHRMRTNDFYTKFLRNIKMRERKMAIDVIIITNMFKFVSNF